MHEAIEHLAPYIILRLLRDAVDEPMEPLVPMSHTMHIPCITPPLLRSSAGGGLLKLGRQRNGALGCNAFLEDTFHLYT